MTHEQHSLSVDVLLANLPSSLTRTEQFVLRGKVISAWKSLNLESSDECIPWRVVMDVVDSTDRLLEGHMRLVVHEAKLMLAKNKGFVSMSDLIAAGLEGLCKALTSFNFDTKVRFWTYARYSVRGEMSRQLRDSRWMIRITESDYRLYLSLMKAFKAIDKGGVTPTVGEFAQQIGMSVEKVSLGLVYLFEPMISLNRSVGDDIELGELMGI